MTEYISGVEMLDRQQIEQRLSTGSPELDQLIGGIQRGLFYFFYGNKALMETLFQHQTTELVKTRGVQEAQDIAANYIKKIRLGKADPAELVISKRLRRELRDYEARQPHIVAAMLGKDSDMANYILMNTESSNPYLRVMPASKLDEGHRGYDKKKYALMVRRAAWNLLRPFVPGEISIGTQLYERTKLESYV
jgi:hypothetical protein